MSNLSNEKALVWTGVEYHVSGPKEFKEDLPHSDCWERLSTDDSQQNLSYGLSLSYANLLFKSHKFDDDGKERITIDLNKDPLQIRSLLTEKFMQRGLSQEKATEVVDGVAMKDLEKIGEAAESGAANEAKHVTLHLIKKRLVYVFSHKWSRGRSLSSNYTWSQITLVIGGRPSKFFNPDDRNILWNRISVDITEVVGDTA